MRLLSNVARAAACAAFVFFSLALMACGASKERTNAGNEEAGASDAATANDAGAPNDASDDGAANEAGAGLPPSPMFGFSESATTPSAWPKASFGMQRFWDSPPLQWPSINTDAGVFDFTNLDADLALAYSKGTFEGLYTLARTPPWATSKPTDTSCHYTTTADGGTNPTAGLGNGECDAPSDLNADGSGANAIWKAWITAIATHVNDPTYLQTHAHIRYWEAWNEPDTQAFWAGSIAQLARLVEDLNCIVTGRGVVHENGDGTATPCTATPIDPTAEIVMPAGHALPAALPYAQNELYCTASPTGYELPCPNPPNAIATAVDIINFHMKPGSDTGTPTAEAAMQMYVANINGILLPAERAKPLWDGEAQYAEKGFIGVYLDDDMAASFMPRFYLIDWTLGISGMAWYNEAQGPTTVLTSYQQTYNWLEGSTLTTPCAANGTVWSCTISKAGKESLVMWDTAQTCSNGSCTTSSQTVASSWETYQDMTSASTAATISGHAVPVGIKPIVLAP
jgi:hypothetical protein